MTAPARTQYEVVVGLEVHAQVRARSKMFCSCDSQYFDTPPNTHVCPVCLGMPGSLPVINERAVQATVLMGLALGSTIPPHSKFDRKNYPYPDLMKGYQISQYDQPLCVGGGVDIEVDGVPHHVALERIHLEEDTARLLHRESADGGYSLLDVNRAGVPLMEIVSKPDIRSAEQAAAYLRKLRQVLRYLGVSDADMEKGSFRCDANVSLRRFGAERLGAKVEIKNMNSFRGVQRAIEFETVRQAAILDAGGTIAQETRGYIDADGSTVSQRSKEEAHDYRYFPEPDLPPLAISRETVEALRALLPELPDAKRARFEAAYGVSADEARVLAETRERADAFEETVRLAGGAAHAKAVARWMTGDVLRLLNTLGGETELADTRLTPDHIAELATIVEDGTITATSAKAVLDAAFESGEMPRAIVAARGLAQVRDTSAIDEAVVTAIAQHPKAVEDYRAGKDTAIQFLIGQVMRQMRGRADVAVAADLLRRHLDRSV